MIKWTTIIFAVLGLAMGVWTVATSKERLPNPPPAQPPSVNPFARAIAATGIVEAASRDIAVAAPEGGLVTRVFAEVNQDVARGEPLFELDRRPLEAELLRAEAALAAARAELERVRSLPRPEDLPPLEAAVERARVALADAQDQHLRTRQAYEARAATPAELTRRSFAVQAAEAELAAAEAELARVRAGASPQELAVAQAAVDQAEAAIRALQIRLDRMTVRAPIDGTILKRFVEPGQYVATGTGAPGAQAMVMGDISTLHVRAQVDEEDAPLLRPRSNPGAVARVRGAVPLELPLRMVRIEPWALPKTQITGASTERVDTRVVEVVFEVEDLERAGETPVFLGQVVDVFIEVPTDEPWARDARSDEPRP